MRRTCYGPFFNEQKVTVEINSFRSLLSIFLVACLKANKLGIIIHLSLHTNKCTSIIYYLKSVLILIKILILIKTDFK
jgi:hypothetical protein